MKQIEINIVSYNSMFICIYYISQELIVFGMRTRMGVPRSRFSRMTGGKILDEVKCYIWNVYPLVTKLDHYFT